MYLEPHPLDFVLTLESHEKQLKQHEYFHLEQYTEPGEMAQVKKEMSANWPCDPNEKPGLIVT